MIPNKKDTLVLQQTTMPCSLGWCIAAATDSGVCFMALGDDPDILRGELEKRFPHAQLIAQSAAFKKTAEQLAASIEQPALKHEIPLDLHGTPFQKQVWQGLTTIPAGRTLSYKELAERIGRPGSIRAVANACGANPVAVIVPCHRVIRSDGTLGGYRGGIERKEKLLALEQTIHSSGHQQ